MTLLSVLPSHGLSPKLLITLGPPHPTRWWGKRLHCCLLSILDHFFSLFREVIHVGLLSSHNSSHFLILQTHTSPPVTALRSLKSWAPNSLSLCPPIAIILLSVSNTHRDDSCCRLAFYSLTSKYLILHSPTSTHSHDLTFVIINNCNPSIISIMNIPLNAHMAANWWERKEQDFMVS